MAKIKIEDVIDHLDTDIRNALELTIKKHYPDVDVDKRAVFRTFRRMVGRKCMIWENVPDNLVEKE